jgi:hypothetical protein
MLADMDWSDWHDAYDRPNSELSLRLKVVQERIVETLDASPPGPLQIISFCAGEGRDLLEVLDWHLRCPDVTARLVELDERNVEVARQTRLRNVEVVAADASLTDNYLGRVPADLVLLCGVFGNISDDDIRNTIDHCDQLCRTGGTVIWTRHRNSPDAVPQICDWFQERGFERTWLSDRSAGFGVGVHRFTGTPKPLAAGERLFQFLAHKAV